MFVLLQREKNPPCCRGSWSPRLMHQDELAMNTWDQGEGEPRNLHPEGHGGLFSCCRKEAGGTLTLSSAVIHVLGGLVVFLTDGLIEVYSVFLYSYAVDPPMSLKHKMAGYLASVFWATITVGRLVSIPLSCWLQPVHMLIANLAGIVITTLLLLLLYADSIFLFVGTFFLGFFLSSIVPCMLAYTEDVLNYQGSVTTVLVTCAGAGEMFLQIAVGLAMDSMGSYSFLVCSMVSGAISLGLFFALLLFCHMHRYRAKESKQSPLCTALQRGATVPPTDGRNENSITLVRCIAEDPRKRRADCDVDQTSGGPEEVQC